MSKLKFEIHKNEKDEYRFLLKAINGEVLMVGKWQPSKNGCINDIKKVRESRDIPYIDHSSPPTGPPPQPVEDHVKSKCIEELFRETQLLHQWIGFTRKGGWSTHLVNPMQKRIMDLRHTLFEITGNIFKSDFNIKKPDSLYEITFEIETEKNKTSFTPIEGNGPIIVDNLERDKPLTKYEIVKKFEKIYGEFYKGFNFIEDSKLKITLSDYKARFGESNYDTNLEAVRMENCNPINAEKSSDEHPYEPLMKRCIDEISKVSARIELWIKESKKDGWKREVISHMGNALHDLRNTYLAVTGAQEEPFSSDVDHPIFPCPSYNPEDLDHQESIERESELECNASGGEPTIENLEHNIEIIKKRIEDDPILLETTEAELKQKKNKPLEKNDTVYITVMDEISIDCELTSFNPNDTEHVFQYEMGMLDRTREMVHNNAAYHRAIRIADKMFGLAGGERSCLKYALDPLTACNMFENFRNNCIAEGITENDIKKIINKD